MSRILAVAPSGFGKTLSIGAIEELGHLGLDPKETYIISVTSKPLTFPGSVKSYPITTPDNLKGGRRIVTNNPEMAANVLLQLRKSPFKNIVIDDFNYLMQDWYMDNALKTGWDAPKKIGFFMGKIFDAIEKYEGNEKNVIILAHGEDVAQPDGRVKVKLKTTGRMVDEYITPEGKFDIVLVGRSRFDSSEKKVIREYLTNEDEFYSSPKSPFGMFDSLYIPNDLGYVINKAEEYYNKEAN